MPCTSICESESLKMLPLIISYALSRRSRGAFGFPTMSWQMSETYAVTSRPADMSAITARTPDACSSGLPDARSAAMVFWNGRGGAIFPLILRKRGYLLDLKHALKRWNSS